MRLCAFGGDERMTGALAAAQRAGWETMHIRCMDDVPQDWPEVDAVMLPWPHSFREGWLTGGKLETEKTIALIPPCRYLLCGSGAGEIAQAEYMIDPSKDEAFLRTNAQLTAEGAVARAMHRRGHALLGSTCVVTGFGRIAMELTARLTAMGAFVIVCARNEMQMRRAHAMGAHPMALERIASACAQADVVFNTVPARILPKEALERIGRDALLVELASPPYGADPELTAQLGLHAVVEGGLPGRYAPLTAGAALFEALQRAICETGGEAKADE